MSVLRRTQWGSGDVVGLEATPGWRAAVLHAHHHHQAEGRSPVSLPQADAPGGKSGDYPPHFIILGGEELQEQG